MAVRVAGEDFDSTINKIIEHHTQSQGDVFPGYSSAFHVVQQTMALVNNNGSCSSPPISTPTVPTPIPIVEDEARTTTPVVPVAIASSTSDSSPTQLQPHSQGLTTHPQCTQRRSKNPSDDRERSLKFVCPKCGMDFGRELYYEQHLDNVHHDLHTANDLKMLVLSSTEAECLICGSQIYHYTVRDMQAHHLMHLQYKPYRCKCHNYSFNDKESALAHITYRRKHEPISPVLWEAGESRILDDGAHYDPEYPETGIGYTCPECGISFNGEDLWKAHCNDMHDFKSMEGLNMMRLDMSTVRCNECSSTITGKWDNYKLRRHKLTHSPFKSFYCRLCKYSRKRKDDILSHIRQTHIPRGKKYY